MEIRWSPERFHEEFADYRRVARVFVKPVSPPVDGLAFLNGLRHTSNVADKLDRVALVIQNLLLDKSGQVTATPLTYEVQVRRFVHGPDGKVLRAELNQYELSRRLLLAHPESGGLESIDPMAPIYLASGGNDLDFASDYHLVVDEPILVRLQTRCTACHGLNTEAVFTFDIPRARPPRSAPPAPVALLKAPDNEHARYVIRRKVERPDFKALQGHGK
jgi:hypothetical protein